MRRISSKECMETNVTWQHGLPREKLRDGSLKFIHSMFVKGEKLMRRNEVLAVIDANKPTILERKKVGDITLSKILDFVATFINGMAA